MNVSIKSISLQNFKGCKNATYNFGEKTTIRGRNASGKSTIFDALTWVLFNKDSLGNEKFSIRPLDADGNQIDNVEINVTVVLDIDGKEVELSKTQKQKWTKKRGSDAPTFEGNVNSYEIDGYPKTEKDYKQFISDIVSEDVFKMLTSPTYFHNLPWKEQRAILMRFVDGISDVQLAREHEEFSAIVGELEKAPSTDDIQKKYQKAVTELKKKQSELPTRIDEQERMRVDVDVAELELQKSGLKEKIAENNEKQEDVLAQIEKQKDEIAGLKVKLGDMQRTANEKSEKKRNEIETQIVEKNRCLYEIANTIQKNNREIAGYEQDIESGTKQRNRLAEQWKTVKAEQFDENTAICPTCHRELPQDERERLLSEFEASKAERLAKIEKDGFAAKEDVENAKKMIEQLEQCNKENESNKAKLENEILKLEKQMSEIPTSTDISGTDEYKAIQQQITDKESVLQQANATDEIRLTLKYKESQLQEQLTEVERQIAKAEQNAQIDDRIAELQMQQREVAQKVSDAEKMLYTLEQFIRFKMDRVSESINAKFDGVSFKLFENQINGGLKETCELTVHGVPYGSLNNGHKIVAGLKIIKALQELYGVSVCAWIDNAESVNNFNIPYMNCQLILLSVDDGDLMVETTQQ